jgi:two-component system sensor kinase FixL
MAHPGVFSQPAYLVALAFLAGYVTLDWISFIHPFAAFGITPWNPPPGLCFVLVLLFGQRFIPLLFAAPLLADLLVRHLPFSWSVEILTVALTGGVYAFGLSLLLRPATRFNPALASMRDLVVLLFVAGTTSGVVASGYVGVLVVFGLLPASDYLTAAAQFWVGDMIGIAVVAPAALVFLTRGRLRQSKTETAAQIAAVLGALVLVFVYSDKHHFQLFYALFLPIIWMAVRGGLEAVAIGILVTQIGLILGIQFVPSSEVDITAFQALMLVLAMTGLIAGALVNEHRSTETQLRLHQDSLARLARLGSMGELAAAVAHEINQPLTAAGTYARMVAETLHSSIAGDRELAETAGKAAAQVTRAAEVVRRLRALIRLDQSGRAPISVERIVGETLDLARPQLDRHNIAVRCQISAGLPPVMADLLQIEQVMLNLVRNAVDAIDQTGHTGGTVTISAARSGATEVEIRIHDTGPGFPAEFSGVDLAFLSSTKPEGLGVGLSLCRSIIEAHGGRLYLANGTEGALVRFSIPVAGEPHGA